MNRFINLRQELHRFPEISGTEKKTAEMIISQLHQYNPDKILQNLGGNGVAAVFNGNDSGKTVLVRCELDALPQTETLDLPYKSVNKGAAHKCGHDGHMAILVALAERLQKNKIRRGSVILLFQPAEETGSGARAVLEDREFSSLSPDYAIALHNLPGFPLGTVVTKDDFFASASEGIHFHLEGKTAHAAEPEAGISPALAIAQLIQIFSAIPQNVTPLHEATKVTVIHARVGEEAFGTSPGEGDVMITLRAHKKELLEIITKYAIEYAEGTADMYKLKLTVRRKECFPETKNDKSVVQKIKTCAKRLELPVIEPIIPFPWSEDFGHFTNNYKGALFGIGSGVKHPALHHPDYDFPDELIETGSKLFESIVKELLEAADL